MYRCGIETRTLELKLSLNLGINCTVVELKRYQIFVSELPETGINCTVVELKQDLSSSSSDFSNGINCTVVELKHLSENEANSIRLVLIVPLWN